MKTTRRVIQFGFLALTLVGVFVVRGNAERWCPFGGVEAIYGYISEGNMLCSLGVSNFYILGAILLLTLLLRRVFCGYMCPIGTISEWLQSGARRVGIRPIKVPYGLDRGLALLKYAVLVIVLFITYRASELLFRGFDPCYALLSRHGEDITVWTYVVTGAVVVGSLFVVMPFCRWLCPLAAVLNPFSRFGLTRITRDENACTDCGECSTACPMAIPVDKVKTVTAARCMSCMDCLDACPTRGEGAIAWGPPKTLGRSWPQAVLVVVMLLLVSAAVGASYAFPLPSFVKMRDMQPGESAPPAPAVVELEIENLTCRGKATLLWYFLDRDDEFAIKGYLKIEAWPGPGQAKTRISYDPTLTEETAIKEAVTEPYFDLVEQFWRPSPFRIEGYDPLDLDD